MIKTEGLSKQFGKFTALHKLDLEIAEGDIFGFIGPNGAGKSTTIKILTGLLTPSEGRASIMGIDCTGRARDLRLKVGYMPDNFGVYEGLRVWEYLDFFCAAYRIPKRKRTEVIERVLDITAASYTQDFYMEALSKGMKQKAGLAKTLLHDPAVVILDEPSSGLDPRARIEMRELIKKLKQMGKTVMVSSHILSELAEISDKIGIIEKGVLLAAGSVNEVMQKYRQDLIYEIEVLDDIERAEKALSQLVEKSFISGLEKIGEMFSFKICSGEEKDAVKLLNLLVKNHLGVKSFRPVEVNLEDVFMAVTNQASGGPRDE
ncbi:MAG: ABC transporter ATP-binding protein [Planctomycetes bacterium]|nr:ABC transporter ATP-binding protein [Planctomycetota bacterium]